MKQRRSSQQGVALIIVLMAFALGSILAAGMMSRQDLMIQRATSYLTQSKAQSLALGAEAFGRQILNRDMEDSQDGTQGVDHRGEQWAKAAVAFPVDAGAIEAQINDLQGKLNLNSLVGQNGDINQLSRERFERLLVALDIRSVRVETLIDWIDRDDQRTGGGGAEDGDYMAMDPPYRAADQPFTHVSELRLMQGITDEDYQALRPHVAALPTRQGTINVNFASAPVIQSLHDRISQGQAESVVSAAEEGAFESVKDFLARREFSGLGLKSDGLGVTTSFFEIAARVSVSGSVHRLVSLVQRNQQGDVVTLSRDSGRTGLITKERIQASE
ncbi:general secretion pathway protein K [Halospina denitrificans]|uniref:Type II secretion system protein K n=1 Tax=Halospina denitrificans TaxID=332522 RepID=A0A4R7JSZ9_9GAMM|nr:type II secretion system minor pseudopilin GspK [Halospina denitrificans]TDT41370.1 general secretion pathway protein K [Halospina denitrificans]